VPGTACKRAPRCGDWCRQCRDWRSVRRRQPEGRRRLFADCKTKGAGCGLQYLVNCACARSSNAATAPSRTARRATMATRNPATVCSGNLPDRDGVFCPSRTAVRAKLRRRHRVEPMSNCRSAAPGTNMDKACLSTCKFNPGWACTGTPPSCHQTVCGDGKVEGNEDCDDGNTVPTTVVRQPAP